MRSGLSCVCSEQSARSCPLRTEVSASGHSCAEADRLRSFSLASWLAEANRPRQLVPFSCHLVARISENDTM